MKFRPQLKAAAWGVSLALLSSTAAYAGGWGVPAQGDTGQGVDTVMGDRMNPRGLDTTTQPDTDGLGPFHAPVAHTPTGAQYSVPWKEPADSSFYGDIEFGFLGSFGDADAAKFQEYGLPAGVDGKNNGLSISNFNFGAEKGGHYFNFSGGDVGNDDQYYSGVFGSYNDWRLRFFYNETPHVFATDARLIWNGAGTNVLALKPSFQQNIINEGGKNTTFPSATTGIQNPNASANNGGVDSIDNALRDTIAQAQTSTLALYRDKGGLRYDIPINDKWNFYTSYSIERRTGDRDYGQTGGGFPGAGVPTASANGQNGQPFEVVEPINYTTHEIAEGTGYSDDKNALNIVLTASIFEDHIKDVMWQDPDVSPYQVAAAPAGVLMNRTWQNFTTPPDNQAYTLNLDYSRVLGFWNGHFTTDLSAGRQNQNDALQPYTTATGANASTPQGNMAFWNSLIGPNGLPTTTRDSADLNNNVYLANFGLNFQPTDKLSVDGKLRYYEVHNVNNYVACNPSLAAAYGTTCENGLINGTGTGALSPITVNGIAYTPAATTINGVGYAPIYGYVGEDGNNVDLDGLTQTGQRVRSYNTSWHQTNFTLNGDYQLLSKTSLNLSYDRENVFRADRERDWTFEDKIKLGLADRSLGAGTFRASYEYDHRTGSDWQADQYMLNDCAANNVAVCSANYLGGGIVNVGGVYELAPEDGKYDLSDRTQHIIVARYNYAFSETLDGMITGRHKVELYPDPTGYSVSRDFRHEDSLSLELNWQPSTTAGVYGYYTFQQALQAQQTWVPSSALETVANGASPNCATVAGGGTGTGIGCGAALGGANSVFSNMTNASTFRYHTNDVNNVFGLGGNKIMSWGRIDANYQFEHNSSPMDFSGTAITAATGVVTYNNAFSFPSYTWNRQQLNLNVTVPISDKLAIRGLYVLDKTVAHDWHYDGLSGLADVTGNGRYYTNPGDSAESYTASVFGVFAQYKM